MNYQDHRCRAAVMAVAIVLGITIVALCAPPHNAQTTLELSPLTGVQSIEPVVQLGPDLYLARIETHVIVTALKRKVTVPQVEYLALTTKQIQAVKNRIP